MEEKRSTCSPQLSQVGDVSMSLAHDVLVRYLVGEELGHWPLGLLGHRVRRGNACFGLNSGHSIYFWLYLFSSFSI
jgi:hypothetical protein